jgi:hypothetical protein
VRGSAVVGRVSLVENCFIVSFTTIGVYSKLYNVGKNIPSSSKGARLETSSTSGTAFWEKTRACHGSDNRKAFRMFFVQRCATGSLRRELAVRVVQCFSVIYIPAKLASSRQEIEEKILRVGIESR